MSHVYTARDSMIGRIVAVKILTGAGSLDDSTRARFVREAQLAGNVIHDNIIRVYDFGEQDGQLFMVMEFLEGEDLNDAIRNGRAGTLDHRVHVALQIANALDHVHSLQIVHRDLKPHNVFITKNGVAKLMDFGIAKTDDTSLTKTGFALGTPSYMAPEQVLGKPVNHLSDVYSFGILLFELIAETKPLGGDSVERVFWRILNEPVDLAPLQSMGVPQALQDLISRCTAKDPTQRPQGFAEIRQELERTRSAGVAVHAAAAPGAERTLTTQTPVPPPAQQVSTTSATYAPPAAVPEPQTTRPKWLIPAILGGVLLIVAVVAGLMLRSGPEPGAGTVATQSAKPPAPTLAVPSGDMVLIPAGAFLFGKEQESRELPAYYIDRTEVTNAVYAAFINETGYTPPEGFAKARPEFPVVNITMNDAREFARWAGKRLPSAAEWEKAARGTDGRSFPWGNEPSPAAAVKGGAGLRAAATDLAASPFGVLEMTGNVFELVDEKAVPSERVLQGMAAFLDPKPTLNEPWCSIRGGSYMMPLFAVFESGPIPERHKSPDIGFRCVRDVR
jgi:eukaryotic-like serine/threonine-protein kinase